MREIYIGVPGEFTHVCTGEAEITLESAGEITEDDVNRVQDAVADELKIAELGGYVMHRSPAWFVVDDGKKTMMPLGAHGERLRAQVSFVVAEPVFIADMKNLMGSLVVAILGFLSPTLGESLLLLSIEERDRVALLVDVGYLNTEVSVVEGDAITYHAMLPLGGGQITADLCEELRIPMRAAEQILSLIHIYGAAGRFQRRQSRLQRQLTAIFPVPPQLRRDPVTASRQYFESILTYWKICPFCAIPVCILPKKYV